MFYVNKFHNTASIHCIHTLIKNNNNPQLSSFSIIQYSTQLALTCSLSQSKLVTSTRPDSTTFTTSSPCTVTTSRLLMRLPHIITNRIRATISCRSWLGYLVSTHPLIASLSVIPACMCVHSWAEPDRP